MNKIDNNIELEAFHKQVGLNIKRLRKIKGYSQLQLANAIGHESVGHIAKAELYKYGKKFSLDHLYLIAKEFNIPVSMLLEDTNIT